MALLQGFDGTVTVDSSAVGKVKKWTADVSFKETEEGPLIGSDGTTEVVTTAKSIKGTLECIIPSGKDTGQTRLLTQGLAMTTVALTLTETNGYTVTLATAKISGIKVDNDGGGSVKL